MYTKNLELTSRIFSFTTLKNVNYSLKLEKNKEIKWNAPSVSKLQTSVKKFLKSIWFNDIVFEEFPLRIKSGINLRFDFYNATRRIAVEVMGDQHTRKVDFFHKDEDAFWKGVENDRLKELFCEKNKIRLVELYPSNIPIDYEWLKNTYKEICWPKQT